MIIRTKESLSIIIPHEHALLLYLIHYPEELRQEDAISVPKDEVKSYKVVDKELKMAENLIKEMTVKWQPEKYHNVYQETMRKWIDQAVSKETKAGKKTKRAKTTADSSVVDFVALLKESMAKRKDDPSKKTAAKTKPAPKKKSS